MDCPVCERKMAFCGQIGEYCVHDDCPVKDDAKLWYKNSKGEWKSQKWVVVRIEGNRTCLKLSEKEE